MFRRAATVTQRDSRRPGFPTNARDARATRAGAEEPDGEFRDGDGAIAGTRGRVRSPEILLALEAFRRRILSMKRAFLAAAGFFGLCLSSPAQSPEQFLFDAAQPNRPLSLSLENRDRFLFAASFGAVQATSDFLPTFSPAGPRSVVAPAMLDSKDSIDNMEFKSTDRVRASGEVGFLYGQSTGKYGREDFQTYIIGTVGNDKFSITAGYYHQELSGQAPRWRR